MDRDTVIESVRYRCWERGEDYEAFVVEYSSEAELRRAGLGDGLEADLARALLIFKHALDQVCEIAERIPHD